MSSKALVGSKKYGGRKTLNEKLFYFNNEDNDDDSEMMMASALWGYITALHNFYDKFNWWRW